MTTFKRRWQNEVNMNAMSAHISQIEDIGGKIVKDIFEKHSKTLLTKDKAYLANAILASSVDDKMDDIQSEISNFVFSKINLMLSNIFEQQNNLTQSAIVLYLAKAYLVMKLYYMIEALKNTRRDQLVVRIPRLVHFQDELVSRN